MNIVQLSSSGTYQVSDSWSSVEDTPREDTTLGGTNDLKNITFTKDGQGNGIVSYFRALNTGDKYDTIVKLDDTQPLIMAWGDGSLQFHGDNRRILSLTISSTSSSDIVDGGSNGTNTTTPSNFDLFSLHGISLIIVWTVFNFFGYISARFLKHRSWWVWVHRIGSSLTAVWSIGIIAATIRHGT